MAIDKASVFRAALLQLDVDPEAVTAFDSAETEDEVHAAGTKLVEAAIERGRALVSHGEAQAKVDHNLQIRHLRKILGGADDENIVQLAGRVMTDLRNARAAVPAVPPTSAPVDKAAEDVRIKLGGILHFPGELETGGPSWLNILSAVRLWRDALLSIGAYAGIIDRAAADPSAMRHIPARDIYLALCSRFNRFVYASSGTRRPTIDEDDTIEVVADITALKQINDTFIKMTVRLVSPEDLQYLTLGRAWLRCNASEDIPL